MTYTKEQLENTKKELINNILSDNEFIECFLNNIELFESQEEDALVINLHKLHIRTVGTTKINKDINESVIALSLYTGLKREIKECQNKMKKIDVYK